MTNITELIQKLSDEIVSLRDRVSVLEKKKRSSKFDPPTKREVLEYFKENGYSKGEDAYEYYNVADWKDSTGKQIKSWKQKMRGVWFRDENKIRDYKIVHKQNIKANEDKGEEEQMEKDRESVRKFKNYSPAEYERIRGKCIEEMNSKPIFASMTSEMKKGLLTANVRISVLEHLKS